MKANPNMIYLVHFLSAHQFKNHVGDCANLKIVGRTITNRLVHLLLTHQIAREKQRKQLGGSAIANRETDAKNASAETELLNYLLVVKT
jgi:hypothetical protein